LSYDGAAAAADDRVPDIAVWHFNRRTGKICRITFWAYWRFCHNKPTPYNGTLNNIPFFRNCVDILYIILPLFLLQNTKKGA